MPLNLALSAGLRSAPPVFFLRTRLKWLQLPMACFSHGDDRVQEVGAETGNISSDLGSELAHCHLCPHSIGQN